MRRCIGCMTSYPKEELIRIAYREGALTLDPDGRAEGRGVYLCRKAECVAVAEKKRAFNRAFRTNFEEETTKNLFSDIIKTIII